MRLSTACLACRSRRRKCHIPEFGTSCTYCSHRGIHCTRDIRSSSPASRNGSSPEVPKAIAPSVDKNRTSVGIPPPYPEIPPKEICIELVDLYFDLIHDQFHTLFHRRSFMEDVDCGRAPAVVLFAMMALSARFSKNLIFLNVNPRDRGRDYAKESCRLLDLRDVSLSTAQACVLLGAVSITEGEAAAESVYYCAACRIANLLNLAHRPTSDGLEREVNIRVWWTLCMIDVWSSSGVRLPRQMPSVENIPLPIDEVTFLSLGRGDLVPTDVDTAAGAISSLLAQMIKLNRILLEINDFNERTVSGLTEASILEELVMDLSQKLEAWHSSLPSYMHDTPTNLYNYASQGLGRIFVAVYLGYYHYGQLLFYQFLHGDCQSNVVGPQFYSGKCKAYAESLCEIVYASHSISGCEALYTMVGHILVVASTVQIHTLLFSDSEEQISAARRRLERNFEILSQLRNYWPTLDICFTRLRAFHKACRNSMDDSFRLDQWMLRFLYEFAEPVEDKVVESLVDESLLSWQNIGIDWQDEFEVPLV